MKMASPRHNSDSTPICRCRVLYLGSAVPHVTKDGLQGIQEPLRELYPEQGALGARGIDSWLSVWSNGILLENVDENHKKVTRFFPIESLHYCAAVRYVLVPEKSHVNTSSQPRFLPLDSPFARTPNPNHPPLFACILRRTTGIKVLECHTFICKREMAANALVRCCFHAYADSSYLKHIDTGGASGQQANSIYGTLGNKNHMSSSTNSIEKVEGWRGISSPPPVTSSTLTLDSAVNISSMNNGASLVLNAENSNSNDDISIYNGDENHKIWAGSTRDISVGDEAIYGEYGTSTMRSTKSSRPRQIVNAPPPPPPPPKEEKPSKKSSKEKNRRKKMTGGSREEMYPLMNGSLLRSGNTVRSQGSAMGMYNQIYSNGTLMHPPSHSQMMPNYPQSPPMVMVPATLPHPPRFLVQGPGGRGMGKQRAPILPPPNFLPMTAPPSVFIPAGRKGFKPHPLTMEEPIYMPSNRPMSPVSSYQPCHFPHEAYLMQQYATMDPNPKRKGKNKKAMPLIPVGPEPEWIEPGMYHRRERDMKNGKNSIENRSEEEDSENIYGTQGSRKKDKDPKGSKKSLNGIRREDDSESPYNTGIYRRKGHLNERAFSYSIRQEHRSRSYGSLANLKFTPLPVVPNGGGPPVEAQYLGETISREELKKEREIMQMMQDLELSGGELERSEVPPAVYQQAKQRNAKIRR